MNLKGRDFLKLLDYSAEEIEYLIDLAAELKRKKKEGILHDELRGKNIALVFEKTSTRTRCSFEVAASDLGIDFPQSDRLSDWKKREYRRYCTSSCRYV